MDYTPLKFNEANEALLEEACKNAAIRLDRKNGIVIGEPDAIYAISVTFLEEVMKALSRKFNNTGSDASVEIHRFMTITLTNRESDEGEKDGNIVPVLSAGDSCKQLAKNDAETEKDAE